MFQRLCALRSTKEAATAAQDSLPFLAHHGRFADGALGRCLDDFGAFRAPIGNDLHHFRNDVPGATHEDRVANPHVLAVQLIHVVQGRVAHRYAADEYRFEPGHGRQCPSPTHLELDVADDGEFFFRRKLVRDRPARCPRDESQNLLIVQAIDLVDDTVDVVAQ